MLARRQGLLIVGRQNPIAHSPGTLAILKSIKSCGWVGNKWLAGCRGGVAEVLSGACKDDESVDVHPGERAIL